MQANTPSCFILVTMQALDGWCEGVLVKRARAAAVARACKWHAHRRLRTCLAGLQDHVHHAHTLRAVVAASVMRSSTGKHTHKYTHTHTHLPFFPASQLFCSDVLCPLLLIFAERVQAVVAVWAAHTQHAAVLRCRARSVSRRQAARQLASVFVAWSCITTNARTLRSRMDRMGFVRGKGLQVCFSADGRLR